MTDRLAEIKKRAKQTKGASMIYESRINVMVGDIDWLITEVERLRFLLADREGEIELVKDFAKSLQDQHARDLKEHLTTHKPECG